MLGRYVRRDGIDGQQHNDLVELAGVCVRRAKAATTEAAALGGRFSRLCQPLTLNVYK
jgi:hypothetical protein